MSSIGWKTTEKFVMELLPIIKLFFVQINLIVIFFTESLQILTSFMITFSSMRDTRQRIIVNNCFASYFLILTILFYEVETKLAQFSVRHHHHHHHHHHHQISNIVSQCILNIIHKYFSDSKKITISCSHEQYQLMVLEQLFKYSNNPIMINANEYSKGIDIDSRIPSEASIILNEQINITEYLKNHHYTKDSVFFMVIWNNVEDIERLFAEFWKFNVIHAFILDVQNDEVNVIEYIPYFKCNSIKTKLLDKWYGEDFKYGKIKRIRNKILITDLNGCHFNVTVVDLPPTIIFPSKDSVHGSYIVDGIEGLILKTIATNLNCSLMYKTPDDGQRWGFITPEPGGAVGDVYYKKSILACGLLAPNIERYAYLDYVVSSSAVTECIAWLVPTGVAKRLPVWVDIFITEFSPVTWYCLILVLSVAIISFTLFAKILNNPGSIIDSFLFLFSSSMGVTVNKPQSKTLKIFYAAWIWYGLLTTTAYESAVKTKLTVPLRYKDINNFHELLEADLELYGLSNTIRVILAGNEDPDMNQLGKIVRTTNKTIDEMVAKMIRDRKTGYLREHTTFFYNAYKNRNAIGQIHQVKQCALSYYPTIYLEKRSPLTPSVRRIVSSLFESGILLWWRSLFIKEGSDSQTKLIQLSIKHMASPFLAYFFGIFVSAMVFMAEYIRYNYYSQNIMKPKSLQNS